MAPVEGYVICRGQLDMRGLHIFTFNELRATEMWRQPLLASVSGEDGQP